MNAGDINQSTRGAVTQSDVPKNVYAEVICSLGVFGPRHPERQKLVVIKTAVKQFLTLYTGYEHAARRNVPDYTSDADSFYAG